MVHLESLKRQSISLSQYAVLLNTNTIIYVYIYEKNRVIDPFHSLCLWWITKIEINKVALQRQNSHRPATSRWSGHRNKASVVAQTWKRLFIGVMIGDRPFIGLLILG
jgi:hypothetical protein